MSRSAFVRSSSRRSTTDAIVLRNTRAADRVALGVVGVEQAFRRRPLDHLGQLPSQVHRILHTGLEALATVGGMHVRGVAGQQHPSLAVGRGLPGRVGEPGDPGGTVDAVVGPVDGDERLAEIAQGGFGRVLRRPARSPGRGPAPRRRRRSRRRGSHIPPCRGSGCRGRRGECPIPAAFRPARPRRSDCWW